MPTIELFWFQDCPNHVAARDMVDAVLAELKIEATVDSIEVPDITSGRQVRFQGSPTIRVNGKDIEPGFSEVPDWAPRCRVYATGKGLVGLPERSWLVAALQDAAR